MAETIEVSYFVEASAESLAHRVAQYFVDRIAEAVAARPRARIAISGGNTPKRTFEMLGDRSLPYFAAIPWEKLELYWVDERCVPPDHPDSNFRMTREALLSKVPLPEGQIFRIQGELPPEEAGARYESDIRKGFRLEGAEMPTFDSILLGMGPDGHTASLFPHSDGLHELMRVAIANHVENKDAWRVTLTSPVLNQGKDVFFLIAGKDKTEVLHRVFFGPYEPETLPSQLIRPKTGRLTLLLDSAAAAMLPKPGADGVGRMEIRR
jgi:6-phosphogluconolactonase